MKLLQRIIQWLINLFTHKPKPTRTLPFDPPSDWQPTKTYPSRYGRISLGQSATLGRRYRNTDPRKVKS